MPRLDSNDLSASVIAYANSLYHGLEEDFEPMLKAFGLTLGAQITQSHGDLVSLGAKGLLIRGDIGSGKTELAYFLTKEGAVFMGEDHISLIYSDHSLFGGFNFSNEYSSNGPIRYGLQKKIPSDEIWPQLGFTSISAIVVSMPSSAMKHFKIQLYPSAFAVDDESVKEYLEVHKTNALKRSPVIVVYRALELSNAELQEVAKEIFKEVTKSELITNSRQGRFGPDAQDGAHHRVESSA